MAVLGEQRSLPISRDGGLTGSPGPGWCGHSSILSTPCRPQPEVWVVRVGSTPFGYFSDDIRGRAEFSEAGDQQL